MPLAPIALFVYNRPMHTRRTVEALRLNPYAKYSDLFIFSDSPKSDLHVDAVREVRSYALGIDGFHSVTIIEREVNYGLARSIIDGVTRLCREQGRVIVVEDDLVSSPYFLEYMNTALDAYEHSDQVMHISGFTYSLPTPVNCDTFFFRVPLCWGWATWETSWRFFEKDQSVLNCFSKSDKYRFNIENSYGKFWEQLELNRSGELDSWFIFWYASVFLRNGLSLFPSQSLIENIGHDGSGINCGKNSLFDVTLADRPMQIANIPIIETNAILREHKRYFRKINPTPMSRIFGRIKRFLMRSLNALRF